MWRKILGSVKNYVFAVCPFFDRKNEEFSHNVTCFDRALILKENM